MRSLFCAKLSAGVVFLSMLSGGFVYAASPDKMRMTTRIPASILVPDEIDTRIGRLEFFDGFPSPETVKKAYDYMDFQRGVAVFLNETGAASMVGLRECRCQLEITDSHVVAVFEDLMDSKSFREADGNYLAGIDHTGKRALVIPAPVRAARTLVRQDLAAGKNRNDGVK